MAKKLKKRRGELSRREKNHFAGRRIDTIFIALVIVIGLAVLICRNGVYELGLPESSGFAAWFLLFIGYVPLLIWSGANLLFGSGSDFVSGREIWVLAGCDLAAVVLAWGAIRWLGRRYGSVFLRIAGNFALMLLVWGIFQILCSLTLAGWERGGLAPLHRHLRRGAEPEKVIVVHPGAGTGEKNPEKSPKSP